MYGRVLKDFLASSVNLRFSLARYADFADGAQFHSIGERWNPPACRLYRPSRTQAEALFRFLEVAIEVELGPELDFLARYDESKAATQAIVDMPDRKIDLFIRLCVQNHGRLSASKRESQFAMLTDAEVRAMGAGGPGRVARRTMAFAMTQRSPASSSARGAC